MQESAAALQHWGLDIMLLIEVVNITAGHIMSRETPGADCST